MRRRRRGVADHPRVVPLQFTEPLGEPRRALALRVGADGNVNSPHFVLDVAIGIVPMQRVEPQRRNLELRRHDIRLPRERAQLAIRGVRAASLGVARVQRGAFTLRGFARSSRRVFGRQSRRLRVSSHGVDVEVQFGVLLILSPPLVLELRELHVPVRDE